MLYKRFKNPKGFTLAEVLVTLAIIGIVAALTIPTLLTNYNLNQYHVRFKKIYSELNQATLMLMDENGGTMKGLTSGAETYESHILRNNLLKYLKYVRACDQGQQINQHCTTTEYYTGSKYLNGTTAASLAGLYVSLVN